MATQCWYCGKPISLLRRLTGNIHPECKKEYKANLKQFEDALIETASSDEAIDKAKALGLDALVSNGKIREEDRKRIGLAVYQKLHKKALDDGHLTAGEREQLKSLQDYIRLDDEEAGAKELDRLRLLISIVEGNLPQITPSVNLQKKEVAHLETTTKWCHLATRRKRVAGTRAKSVRLSKDFRFKIPATSGHTEEYTELQTVDEGKVIITSKRLIFVGKKKNLNTKLDKILDLDPYTDAVAVHRGTRYPTIFMLEDPKMFYAVLVGAMNTQLQDFIEEAKPEEQENKQAASTRRGTTVSTPEGEEAEFDVILKEVGRRKIKVIKVVCEATGLGLKEAKDLVDSAPSLIAKRIPKEQAKDIKVRLEAEGAVVEFKLGGIR
jgi:ribosomal protein L7/L12